MKLKKGFLTHKLGEQDIVVAVGPATKWFHGLLRSNETAALILRCLEKETTEENIVDAICASYDVPRQTAAQDVHEIISQLTGYGVIE